MIDKFGKTGAHPWMGMQPFGKSQRRLSKAVMELATVRLSWKGVCFAPDHK